MKFGGRKMGRGKYEKKKEPKFRKDGTQGGNKTNKVLKLHPLMDYNKAFLSYETISGARCQTSERPLSQQQAAAEGVQKIGLNQIKDVDPAWFADGKTREMFFQRLDFLRLVETER